MVELQRILSRSYSSAMEFPQEVLLQIFREACSDDGATARSLSLVSRYIYQVSLEVRFHSVAIAGPTQLQSFAHALESHPAALRKVRHLFVDYQPGKESTAASNNLGAQTRYLHTTSASDFWKSDPISSATFTRVLQLASPTLHSLHLVSETPRTSVLPPVSLPKATSITVRGPLNVSQKPQALFPSLRQLSISSFHECPGHMLEDIASQAPLLTEVTFAPENPSHIFTKDLSRALSVEEAPKDASKPSLPSECRVEVHVGTQIVSQDIWGMSIQNEMLRVLSYIASCTSRFGVKETHRPCGYKEEKARWLLDMPSIIAC